MKADYAFTLLEALDNYIDSIDRKLFSLSKIGSFMDNQAAENLLATRQKLQNLFTIIKEHPEKIESVTGELKALLAEKPL